MQKLLLGRLGLVDARQFEAGLLRRWIGGACLLLALFFSGLEATHVHFDPHTSSDVVCLICVSAPAQAPAVVVDALPILLTFAMVALLSVVPGNSLANRMEPFIRPPPRSL